jgi:isoleucyl-tRNA synthetase
MPPFQNCVVNGMVLAEDGSKMSKRKQNYPSPERIFDEYGADALRAYLINSPIVRAEPLKFSEDGVREVVRTVLIPLRNAWSFFVQYANIDGWHPVDGIGDQPNPPLAERPELDRWLHERAAVARARSQHPDGGLLPLPGHPPGARLHRRPHQLVHPPQPPPLLAHGATSN